MEVGTYEYVIWKDGADEASVADTYFKKPARVVKRDGAYYAQVTVTNPEWWQHFKVNDHGKWVEARIVSEDLDEKTRLFEFPVASLDEPIDANVHIIVTDIPGFQYDNTYDIRFVFGERKESTLEPIVEQIDVHAWDREANAPSRAASLFKGAERIVRGDEQFARVTVKQGALWLDFSVDGQSIEPVINEEANEKTYEFPLTDANGWVDVQANVQAGPNVHTYDIPLKFGEAPVVEDETEDALRLMTFDVLKEDGTPSGAKRHFGDPVTVVERDGKTYVQMDMKNEQFWQGFRVWNGVEMKEVTWLERDSETHEGRVEFEVASLEEPVDIDIHIVLTGIPEMDGYVQKSKLQFVFKAIDTFAHLPAAKGTVASENAETFTSFGSVQSVTTITY